MTDQEKDKWTPVEPPFEEDEATPKVERTKSVYEEAMEELGFVENPQLVEIRKKLMELMRATPEPAVPKDEYEDFEIPESVVALIREYQESAHEMIDQIPGDDTAAFAGGQIALILATDRILYEGGWTNVVRNSSNLEDANDYARNMAVQYPGIFEKIAEQTKQPYHSN